MGIAVSDEALASFIRDRYKDPASGQSRYPALVAEVQSIGAREEDLLAMERRGIGQSLLAELISIPEMLITPRQAEADYRREHEEATASAVFFISTNYLSSVTVTPDALGKFFTNRMSDYRIAEKFVVAFVRFAGTNHFAAAEADLAKVTDLTNRLEKVYEQRGTNAFLNDQGIAMPKSVALIKLRDEALREGANMRAREAATEFYNEVSQVTPLKAESLDAVAAKRGLKVEITQPFSKSERPLGLEGLPTLVRDLDSLTPDSPVSEPLMGLDGAYIAAIKVRIPSMTPALDAVRARVTEDYRRSQAREAARNAGQAFHAVATNALATGKTFAAVATAQKLTVVDLPAFSLSSTMVPGLPPYADLSSLKDAAFALKAGGVSPMGFLREGGYVLFLKERKAPTAEAVKAGLPAYITEQRSRRSNGPFVQWFTSEWDKSGLSLAIRPRPSTNGPVQN
jgi:hypothetical protein